MKHRLLGTLGVIVLVMVAFGAIPAEAATAAGPYYATPSWDQTLPANTRFIVLTNMNSEAVLDRETGLVWEKSPTAPPTVPNTFNWEDGQIHCNRLTVGNRLGWRLPTVQELASLVDPTQANPALPTGHPFIVRSASYWSATTYAGNASVAWFVAFDLGLVVGIDKSNVNYVWCVRGGQGVDPQ